MATLLAWEAQAPLPFTSPYSDSQKAQLELSLTLRPHTFWLSLRLRLSANLLLSLLAGSSGSSVCKPGHQKLLMNPNVYTLPLTKLQAQPCFVAQPNRVLGVTVPTGIPLQRV